MKIAKDFLNWLRQENNHYPMIAALIFTSAYLGLILMFDDGMALAIVLSAIIVSCALYMGLAKLAKKSANYWVVSSMTAHIEDTGALGESAKKMMSEVVRDFNSRSAAVNEMRKHMQARKKGGEKPN